MNIRYKISYYISAAFFTLFLILQICFWNKYNDIKPDMIIVPTVPSTIAVKAISLGDSQFYFRYLGLKVQNAGDSWGRFTALNQYNYSDLLRWFNLLDTLDNNSNFIASLAAYYYSQSQNPEDTIYVINYLRNHYKHDPVNKWWWLSQATYIANHKLKDKDLALELAYEMHNLPSYVEMPLWARQMAAFILEEKGEMESAKQIIADILYNQKDFTIGELNFMEYFITERLENEEFREELMEVFTQHRNAVPEEERLKFNEYKPDPK